MERTLLLVDDEENIVSSLVRLLRQDGYKILRANSGKDGLALLAQNEVGVIISDQRMPEMTGTEFLSQAKELYPDTVRLVLSGYTELSSVTEAINRGAVYKFLTKPWDDELLRANVDEAFRRYEMRVENVRLSHELQQAHDELLTVNHELEQRVENKTREVMRNLDMLRISQEILEHLPVAVIGISDDGMIACANQMARKMFGSGEQRPLLGEDANDVMPAGLMHCIAAGKCTADEGKKLTLADGREINCWCSPMGELSHPRGVVLVINAVQ